MANLRPELLKVATPFPFPEQLAVEFLQGLDEVLCLEELDPVIEQELVYLCGKYHLPTKIRGKLTHDVAPAGENSCDSVAKDLAAFLVGSSLLLQHRKRRRSCRCVRRFCAPDVLTVPRSLPSKRQ